MYAKAKNIRGQKRLAMARAAVAAARDAAKKGGRGPNYTKIAERFEINEKDLTNPKRCGAKPQAYNALIHKQPILSRQALKYADENLAQYRATLNGTLSERDNKQPMTGKTLLDVTRYQLGQARKAVDVLTNALARATEEVKKFSAEQGGELRAKKSLCSRTMNVADFIAWLFPSVLTRTRKIVINAIMFGVLVTVVYFFGGAPQ